MLHIAWGILNSTQIKKTNREEVEFDLKSYFSCKSEIFDPHVYFKNHEQFKGY